MFESSPRPPMCVLSLNTHTLCFLQFVPSLWLKASSQRRKCRREPETDLLWTFFSHFRVSFDRFWFLDVDLAFSLVLKYHPQSNG